MDLLFAGNSEEEALEASKISTGTYRGWIVQDKWINEVQLRIKSLFQRSELIISSFKPAAAVKLVELTGSEKEQTARQACLDILNLRPGVAAGEETRPDNSKEAKSKEMTITDEGAAEIVKILLASKDKGKSDGRKAGKTGSPVKTPDDKA